MKPRKFSQKLSEQDIEQIVQLRLRGVTVQKIALILHHEHNTVREVVKNAGLANVPVRK